MTSPLSRASSQLAQAQANPRAVVNVDSTTRFTILSSRLIRLEYAHDGHFINAATQLVVSRDIGPVPQYEVLRTEERIEVLTEHLHLTYFPTQGFSPSGLSIRLRQAVLAPHGGHWRFGETWDPAESFPTNLGGTARTLDNIDGRTELNPGLMALHGYALIDDSHSLLLQEDLWVRPRPSTDPTTGDSQDIDLYFFGYGQDYTEALQDFFRLTGPTPLIRRGHLGNWWSRYHKYSETEYLELMDRFNSEDLPFSVAVIDMDWHLVNIDPALGNGWTGYTWNTELFPDPPRFLRALHDRGLEVALNLHPAEGIRAHEDAYLPMAHDLGIDPALGRDIPFNIGDPNFTAAYLKHAHHTLEEQGVDLWWLDWQQGGETSIPGLDPLWMLNHVHYLDSGRERTRHKENGESETYRRRPATFSRFADASSHRTPIGFSGDTITTWASLKFQPEFTATAANIGYFWWSHDIGGHMLGIKDSEMMARWVQLGCFSPINRLHSSNSMFNSKEPWRFSRVAQETITAYLRHRHRLVPYLYTWARWAHVKGIAPIRPLYHDFPKNPGAYISRTEYLFGDLIVVPFVHKSDPVTQLATEKAWIPEGSWFDLPTGRQYVAGANGQFSTFSRPLEQNVVLARAGSMLVVAEDLQEPASANPQRLGLLIVPGADGEFILEEDDGSAAPASDRTTHTRFTVTWDDAKHLAVLEAKQLDGEGVVPQYRDLTIHLLSTSLPSDVHCEGYSPTVTARDANGFTLGAGVDIHLAHVSLTTGLRVELHGIQLSLPTLESELYRLLDQAEIAYETKDQAWHMLRDTAEGSSLLPALQTLDLPESLVRAVTELL